jgi:hypothetical protein
VPGFDFGLFHFLDKLCLGRLLPRHSVCPAMTEEGFDDVPEARQFNTLFASGLSSEKVGTSISNFSPLSLTI